MSAATAGAEMQSPVQIEHTYYIGDNYRQAIPMPAVVTLTFRNESAVTANLVEFNLSDPEGNSATIDDVGLFTTGVPITHTYYVTGVDQGAQASVVAVSFVDGTTWSAIAPLMPLPLPQAPDIPTGDSQ